MLFNSLHFLLFFPFVVMIYFALPHRLRWVLLLAASYYFYMCWNPVYAVLILTTTAIAYWSGINMAQTDDLVVLNLSYRIILHSKEGAAYT